MDPNNFISGAGVSKWVPTAASPRILAHEIRKQKEAQLLHEASGLLPDTAALSKALLDHDVPYADLAPVQNQLQDLLNSYNEEYQKSPFNAFSRDAKEKVKMMQYLVNDPRLKQLASENALFKKHTEKVLEDRLGNNLNVKDGKVGIWRRGDRGKPVLRFVDPDQIRDDDYVTNIAGDVEFINNRAGLSSLDDKYTVDMSSHDKVMDKIRSYFNGVGHTTLDQFNEGTGERIKSNSAQLDAAFKTIADGAGLSQADWNTLYSDYYTKNLGKGPISKQEAKAAILNDIFTMRNTEEVGSDTAIRTPGGTKGIGGGPGDLKGKADAWSLAWAGTTPDASLRQTLNEKVDKGFDSVLSEVKGVKIPFYSQQTLAKGTRKSAEGQPSMALGDNELFRYSGKSYVVNPGNGAVEVQDMSRLKDMVVIDPGRDVIAIALPVDQYGTPADIKMQQKLAAFKNDPSQTEVPKELQPYVEYDAEGNVILREGQFTAVPIIAGDRSTFVPKEYSQFTSRLKEMGYQKHDPSDYEQDLYSDHNKEGIDIDRGMYIDNIFKPVLLVQAPSAESGRQILGGDVKTSTASVAVGSMGERERTVLKKSKANYTNQVSQANL